MDPEQLSPTSPRHLPDRSRDRLVAIVIGGLMFMFGEGGARSWKSSGVRKPLKSQRRRSS